MPTLLEQITISPTTYERGNNCLYRIPELRIIKGLYVQCFLDHFLILFIIQFYLQHNFPFGRYSLCFLGMTCPNNIIFFSQFLREQTKQVHIQHHANLIQQICINRLTLEKMIYQRPFFVNHTSELAGTQTTFLELLPYNLSYIQFHSSKLRELSREKF